MSQLRNKSLPPDPTKVILFPEGQGFLLVSALANTGSSKVVIVRSLKDGKLYVRKESEPVAVMEQEGIQSREVRLNTTLIDVDGIPNLVGWTEYHDTQSSNDFITASYWELYNRGTLEQLKSGLETRDQSLPEDCLWSIYAQILRIMVQTIDKGILHTDAHTDNWFINMKNGALPKVGLGDWGTVEMKPTEHSQLCTAEFCNDACPVAAWWNDCWENLKTFVVSHVRTLAAIGNGSTRLKQRFPYLAVLLEHIEKHKAPDFRTGEAWFINTKILDEWVAKVVQRNRRNKVRPVHTHQDNNFQDLRSSRLPIFDTARSQAQTLKHYTDESGRSSYFWRVATLDEASGTVVAVDGRNGRSGYRDHTEQSSLPTEWLDDHLQLGQMMESMDVDLELSEDQGASGIYDTGFEAYY